MMMAHTIVMDGMLCPIVLNICIFVENKIQLSGVYMIGILMLNSRNASDAQLDLDLGKCSSDVLKVF